MFRTCFENFYFYFLNILKYSTIRITLVILALYCCIPAFGFQQTIYPYRHFTQEDGLPTASINAIEQDRRGFIWIGSDIGLTRFDGYRFKNFTIRDSLPDNYITDLHNDKQGRLWIITGSGLAYMKDNDLHRVDIIEGYEINKVTSFLEDSQGHIWLGTGEELIIIDKTLNKITRTSTQFEFSLVNPQVLFEDEEGFVWMYGKNNNMLVKVKGEELYFIGLHYKLCENMSFQAYPVRGDVYYQNKEGLAKLDFSEAILISHPAYKKAQGFKGVKEDLVTTEGFMNACSNYLSIDSEGQIRTIDGQFNLTNINLSDNLPEDIVITDVYRDKNENLWVATKADGIYFLDNYSYSENKKIRQQLTGKSIEQIFSKNGTALVSADNAVYQLNASGNWEATELPGISCFSKGGEQFFANEEYIFKLENPQRPFYLNGVKALAVSDDLLYFGTREGVSRIKLKDLNKVSDDADAADFTRQLGSIKSILSDRDVNAIFIDKKGACWLGTEQGLHSYFRGKLTQHKDEELILGHSICAIAQTADETIWLATKGAGVIGMKNGKIVNINAAGKLNHDYCTGMVAEDNVLWVATSKGINKIVNIDFTSETFEVSRMSNKRSIPATGIKYISTTKDKILTGTRQGLIEIDKTYFHEKDSIEAVYITGIKVKNKEFDLDSTYTLQYLQNAIQIEFTGINYSHQDNVMYAYQMNGIDPDLVKTDQPGTPLYVLPPGNYTFEVFALNSKGERVSRSSKITIQIKPPFWGSMTFRILVGILLFGLLSLIIRSYLEQRRKAELERLVEQKTKDLNIKILELERSNNELEQFNYVVAHDLKAPLKTTSGFLDLIKRKDGKNMSQEGLSYLDFVGKGVQRLQEMIEDLLIFSGIQVSEKQKNAVDMNKVIGEAIENLHKGIEESEAEIQMMNALPTVIANNLEMLQVFQNLIANGIKYQPRGQKPLIRIGSEELSKVMHKVWVEDNGIGINKQYEDKVFRIFQRLHNQEEYSGTGIGLPICKKIIESNGGSIWFESVEGKGTTFYFTIMASKKAVPVSERLV